MPLLLIVRAREPSMNSQRVVDIPLVGGIPGCKTVLLVDVRGAARKELHNLRSARELCRAKRRISRNAKVQIEARGGRIIARRRQALIAVFDRSADYAGAATDAAHAIRKRKRRGAPAVGIVSVKTNPGVSIWSHLWPTRIRRAIEINTGGVNDEIKVSLSDADPLQGHVASAISKVDVAQGHRAHPGPQLLAIRSIQGKESRLDSLGVPKLLRELSSSMSSFPHRKAPDFRTHSSFEGNEKNENAIRATVE